ncbi:hypothetical protein [Streptomyces sp. RKAG337]|uniref:hypothetical protein n=1 Tax=Streptomyces sp. RKAG337 TaxID=2893404 RepID=UPI0020340E02|nr:hypothetical protein [Streptomyces sp. RKAG337]MCM2427673.1 hypothetical protein [Streptomyces sp. RKAG337]
MLSSKHTAINPMIPAALLAGSIPVMEETVTDLIADLLHWLTGHGSDLVTILDHAQMHFEAELGSEQL